MQGILASGSEQTMTVSTGAILAYLHLAPWNRDDWKEVQPLSGTEERSDAVWNGEEFSRWLRITFRSA